MRATVAELPAKIKNADSAGTLQTLLAAFTKLEQTPGLDLPPDAVKSVEVAFAAKALNFAKDLAKKAETAYAANQIKEGDVLQKQLKELSAALTPRYGQAALAPLEQAVTAASQNAEVRARQAADLAKSRQELAGRLDGLAATLPAQGPADAKTVLNLFNALSAGLVMGFMILPTVSSISTDAMQAVPSSLRQAAYGLGATKVQLIFRVVLPAALSGIVASVVLAMSRAVGETMIVSLAAGQRPLFTFDARETIATMTSFIVQAATGDQPAGSLASRSLYAVAATLFAITLLLNLASQLVVRRYRERYE